MVVVMPLHPFTEQLLRTMRKRLMNFSSFSPPGNFASSTEVSQEGWVAKA